MGAEVEGAGARAGARSGPTSWGARVGWGARGRAVAVALACAAVLGEVRAAEPEAPGPSSAAKPSAKPSAKPAAKDALACGGVECRSFSSPADAFAVVLAEKPRILAVGELHETNGAPKVRSAIAWFTKALLPLLQHKASDLIAETWLSEGNCGDEETQAVEEIGETTQRPETTEDELVTLLQRTKSLDIRPHILQVTCDEYRSLLDEKKELDAEKLLKLVTQLLLAKAKDLHQRNEEHGSKRTVVIYGGAIHNDVAPADDYRAYSYGPELDAVADGHYLELDLYVPELLAADDDLKNEPWFPAAARLASPSRTLLFHPRPASWVMVLPAKTKAR